MSRRRAVAILVLAVLSGCRKTDRAATPTPALSLLPADALSVISVDLARLRQTRLVAKLVAVNPLPEPLLQFLGAFTTKSGIDPLRTFDSVVVAAGSKQRWALVARGQRLEHARLEAATRQALRDRGGDLVAETRGRWTFWSARGQSGVEAFLLDERTLVVAAGGWTEQIAALAGGAATVTSAASNVDLARLCQAVSDRAIWGVATVSEQLRDEWLDDLQTQEAVYLDRLTLTLNVDTGLDGKLTAVMTEAAHAEKIAEDLAQSLVRARLGNQSGPMFDGLLKGVTTYADGNAVYVTVSLGEALLVHWARWLSRYWRIVGAGLPEPSQRATSLRLVPSAGSGRSAAIAPSDAYIFTDWENNRYAMVEASNRTSRPMVPALQLVYRRQSGDMIAPGLCIFPVGVLLAGEKAVCVGPAPPGAVSANYDIHLGDAPTNETRTALTVLVAELGPPFGPLQWVAGRVKNESRSVLEHPQVLVAFHDARGNLVGWGRDDLDGKPLLPGREASFQASSMVIMSASATSFAITAFALGDKR